MNMCSLFCSFANHVYSPVGHQETLERDGQSDSYIVMTQELTDAQGWGGSIDSHTFVLNLYE